MKLKQFTDIKHIRIIKVIQITLLLLGNIILVKHLPSLLSYLIMTIILLLAFLIPKDYQWGIGAKKSTFFRNSDPFMEAILIFVIVMVIIISISWFV